MLFSSGSVECFINLTRHLIYLKVLAHHLVTLLEIDVHVLKATKPGDAGTGHVNTVLLDELVVDVHEPLINPVL